MRSPARTRQAAQRPQDPLAHLHSMPGDHTSGRSLATGGPPPAEALLAPGHFAFEVMSGLGAAANRPGHPLQEVDLVTALQAATSLEIAIEGTPWSDVDRAWTLAKGSLRCADALYVAVAERHGMALLTTDTQIERSGALIRCEVITIRPAAARD